MKLCCLCVRYVRGILIAKPWDDEGFASDIGILIAFLQALKIVCLFYKPWNAEDLAAYALDVGGADNFLKGFEICAFVW